METNQIHGASTASNAGSPSNIGEVKTFYKESLPKFFTALFTEPMKGAYELFSSRPEKSYSNSLFLIITTGLLFTFLPYITAGADARQSWGFKYFVMTGVAVVLCLFIISAFSFLIKIISGKANFKKELLTGGICGIPLSIFIVIAFVFSLLFKDIMQDMMNPATLFTEGFFILIVAFYALLSIVNIFQQSLKSSGTNDMLAWYLSPICILLSLYLTGQIIYSLTP